MISGMARMRVNSGLGNRVLGGGNVAFTHVRRRGIAETAGKKGVSPHVSLFFFFFFFFSLASELN